MKERTKIGPRVAKLVILYLIAIGAQIAISIALVVAKPELSYVTLVLSVTAKFTFFGMLGHILAITIPAFKDECKDKKIYDQTIVNQAIWQVLPGARVTPGRYIDPVALYNNGVVPYYNSVRGSYLIEYMKDGMPCSFSNLRLLFFPDEESVELPRDVFKGQAYTMTFKTNINAFVRVMAVDRVNSNGSYMKGYRPMQKYEKKVVLENRFFNESFDVFASDEEAAFYVLTPYVMEQLLMLRNSYGNFAMAVNGNTIMIAFQTRREFFKMPEQAAQIDMMSVERTKAEFMGILNFAQCVENAINGRTRR